MGFFSSNYNKPGPGVDKDAPSKPSFFVFFEVLKRKFWHLLRVNIMFVIFNIPALLIAFFMSSVYMQKITIDGGLGDFYIRFFLAAFMTLLPIIAVGPVQAGFTYILRNYSREEHSFIWWDFKETFVKNFKQGMAITGIDIVVIYILGIALNFYTSSSNLISVAATSFVVLSLVIFSMMHFYIYPMLVTVKLSVKDIYKNALIFSILKLFPNLLMFVLNLLIACAAFYNILIGVVLYGLLLPSFVGLMNNFFVNPIIKKYVVNPTELEKTEDEEDDDDDEEDADSFYRKEKGSIDSSKTDVDEDIKLL
ncbi:MAG TPA: DUF624 domain-containing protein [Ruminiclostridium sp.]